MMVKFTDGVTFKKPFNAGTGVDGAKVLQWTSDAGMQVMTFTQKTSFTFRLVKNLDYVVEIARYDSYVEQDDEIPARTNWGATLWNSEWDSTLMENSSLSIGESAKWAPTLKTFFPTGSSETSTSPSNDVDHNVSEFLDLVRDVNGFLTGLMPGFE